MERGDLSIVLLFCTQLTFDLILSPNDISRLGIYPYRVRYTYINIISMDTSFYSILPFKVKISLFCLNGQPISRFYKSNDIRLFRNLISCIKVLRFVILHAKFNCYGRHFITFPTSGSH